MYVEQEKYTEALQDLKHLLENFDDDIEIVANVYLISFFFLFYFIVIFIFILFVFSQLFFIYYYPLLFAFFVLLLG